MSAIERYHCTKISRQKICLKKHFFHDLSLRFWKLSHWNLLLFYLNKWQNKRWSTYCQLVFYQTEISIFTVHEFLKNRSELTHPPPQGNRACRSKLTSQNLRLSDIEANSCARDEFEIKFHQSRHKSPIITNFENFAGIVFRELTFSGSKRESNLATLAKICKIRKKIFPRNFFPLSYISSNSLTYWFPWSPHPLLYSAQKNGGPNGRGKWLKLWKFDKRWVQISGE